MASGVFNTGGGGVPAAASAESAAAAARAGTDSEIANASRMTPRRTKEAIEAQAVTPADFEPKESDSWGSSVNGWNSWGDGDDGEIGFYTGAPAQGTFLDPAQGAVDCSGVTRIRIGKTMFANSDYFSNASKATAAPAVNAVLVFHSDAPYVSAKYLTCTVSAVDATPATYYEVTVDTVQTGGNFYAGDSNYIRVTDEAPGDQVVPGNQVQLDDSFVDRFLRKMLSWLKGTSSAAMDMLVAIKALIQGDNEEVTLPDKFRVNATNVDRYAQFAGDGTPGNPYICSIRIPSTDAQNDTDLKRLLQNGAWVEFREGDNLYRIDVTTNASRGKVGTSITFNFNFRVLHGDTPEGSNLWDVTVVGEDVHRGELARQAFEEEPVSIAGKGRSRQGQAWVSRDSNADAGWGMPIYGLESFSATKSLDADANDTIQVFGGSAAATLNLWDADGGESFWLMNGGTADLTVDGNGSDTIDGAATLAIKPGHACLIAATTASGWAVLSDKTVSEFNQENTVPFAAAFRDKFDRTFVVSATASHGEALISTGNNKPDSSLPDTVTDFIGIEVNDSGGSSQAAALGKIQAGDWLRAKRGDNYIIARIAYVSIDTAGVVDTYAFWFDTRTAEAETLAYEQLGTGAGEIRFYRQDFPQRPGVSAKLTLTSSWQSVQSGFENDDVIEICTEGAYSTEANNIALMSVTDKFSEVSTSARWLGIRANAGGARVEIRRNGTAIQARTQGSVSNAKAWIVTYRGR